MLCIWPLTDAETLIAEARVIRPPKLFMVFLGMGSITTTIVSSVLAYDGLMTHDSRAAWIANSDRYCAGIAEKTKALEDAELKWAREHKTVAPAATSN